MPGPPEAEPAAEPWPPHSDKGDDHTRDSYLATTDELSPLQAHIDLALSPNRGLPDVILRIDLNGLRAAGYEIPKPTPVARSNNMLGGGYEMRFPYPAREPATP